MTGAGPFDDWVWASGEEASDPIVLRAGEPFRVDELALSGHLGRQDQDLADVAGLGLRVFRYGMPWRLTEPEPGTYDWRWWDARSSPPARPEPPHARDLRPCSTRPGGWHGRARNPAERRHPMDATIPTTEPASAYGHSPLIGVDHEQSLQQAAELMHRHDIGAVAVTREGDLVGVLSERDLVRAMARAGSREDLVTKWMTGTPVTARPDDPVLDVALLMLEDGIRHLPLVDEFGNHTGMISLRDIERPLLLQAMTPPPRIDAS